MVYLFGLGEKSISVSLSVFRPETGQQAPEIITQLSITLLLRFAPGNPHLAWLAGGPKDALHDQLLPRRIGPGVLAVAQGTIKHSALAHFAGPDNVHVFFLVAFRRAFAEASQDMPVHLGEFV